MKGGALVSRYRRWNEYCWNCWPRRAMLQIEEAAKALHVSLLRPFARDFDELAEQQMLTRIRGGAVAQAVNYDLPLRYKSERHPSEKQRIPANSPRAWSESARWSASTAAPRPPRSPGRWLPGPT